MVSDKHKTNRQVDDVRIGKMTLVAKAVAIACGSLGVATVHAQAELEEIIVTATKRLESARELPYNISAVSADTLEQLRVTDVADVGRVVPGVIIQDRGAATAARGSSILIRGINIDGVSLDNQPNKVVPPVSVYLNETPLFVNLQLMDIERVEVLRGPQGTLYGSGAMGGNIRYVTKLPATDSVLGEFGIQSSGTLAADGTNYRVAGILNVPLSDRFAVRFNLSQQANAGFVDYENFFVRRTQGRFDAVAPPELADTSDPLGSPGLTTSAQDVNDDESTFYRVAARYEGDSFDINFNYFYQELSLDSFPFIDGLNDSDDYTNSTRLLTPFDSEADVASVEASVDFGFGSLVAVSSYAQLESRGLWDLTDQYVRFPFYPDYYGASPRPFVTSFNGRVEELLTQEIRLVSSGGGRVRWLAGLYHQSTDGDAKQRQNFPGYHDFAEACFAAGNPPGGEPCGFGTLYTYEPTNGGVPVEKDLAYFNDFQDEFTDLAVYGELTLDITDDWQVTGGLRYFDQEYVVSDQGGLMFVPGLVANNDNTAEESDTLFKLNTSYYLGEGHQVYFTWSEGFRRGGANALGALGTPETERFVPDTIDNREIGIKGIFGGNLEYTLSYFDIEWEAIQIRASCTDVFLVCNLNSGDATSKGIEFEVNYQATENLLLRAGYANIDAKIGVPSPGIAVNGAQEGDPLPGVPRNSGSVSALFQTQLNDTWTLNAAANIAYYSGHTTSIQPIFNEHIGSHSIVDASIGVSTNAWEFVLFADNLLNETRRITQGSRSETDGAGINATGLARGPRTVGVSARYLF